jgi:hypothetical protein
MTRRRRNIGRLRAASDPVLLARVDQAREIVRLVRAGRACRADLHQEIRAALRRGDTAYALELAHDTGLIDKFIEGKFEREES